MHTFCDCLLRYGRYAISAIIRQNEASLRLPGGTGERAAVASIVDHYGIAWSNTIVEFQSIEL